MTKKVKALLCASLLSVSCFGAATVLSLGAVNAETSVPDFQMHEGASLRLVTDSCGLRFMAELTESKYEAMIDATGETPVYKDGKSFGMLIAPTSYVQSAPEGTTDWVTYLSQKSINLAIPAEKVYQQAGESNYCFTGVLTNIQFNSANLDFIGIGYSCESDFYEYAEFTISGNSRNVAYVAGQALTDSTHDYGEANEAVLLDFLTDYLYRDAGVYAYEGDEATLYYDSLADYDEDTERTLGSTDVVEVAKSLNYSLSYIDLQKDAEISLEAEDKTATLTVTSKVAGVDFSSLIEWSSSNPSVATVANGVVTAVGGGETTIKAKLFGQEYTSTVGVVTKYIASASDLTSLCSTDDVSGYYVLTSDIALSGTFAGITTGTFTGIFDGRGHTISGGDLSNGLLGTTANNVTVRNLAIIDTVVQGIGKGAIAKSITGISSIENTYVNLNKPGEFSQSTGILANSVTGTLTTKNVVTYLIENWASMAVFVSWTTDRETAVSGSNCHAGSGVGDLPNVNTNTGTCTGVENYTSLEAMQTAYANGNIDISWAENFSFYNALKLFFGDTPTQKTYISTAAQLRELVTDCYVAAYYVLTADIDLGNTAFDGITTGTFTGIFDGGGYSIKNGNFSRGLLGAKANNVTVRNLAIENCSANGTGTNGAIAVAISGSSVLENVYINLKSAGSWSGNTGTIAYSVKGTLTVRNLVAYRDDPNNGAAFISSDSQGTTTNGTNAHAGTNKGTPNITVAYGTCTGVENYATLAAMQTAYANKTIDISWAATFSFYQALQTFLTA